MNWEEHNRGMTKSGVVGKSALEIPREVQSAGVPERRKSGWDLRLSVWKSKWKRKRE
jgi:hypothetical protein